MLFDSRVFKQVLCLKVCGVKDMDGGGGGGGFSSFPSSCVLLASCCGLGTV